MSVSLSNLNGGGVDICALQQQGAHHVYVPVVARDIKSGPALDETRREKKRMRISFDCLLGGRITKNAVFFRDIYC